jgi:cell division protein FtsB
MNVDLGIWDKLTRLVVFLLLVAAIAVVALWYTPVIQQNERMRKELLELDLKIEKESETARRLELATRAMQDPRTIERLTRERLRYAKPGETVIHFEPASASMARQ